MSIYHVPFEVNAVFQLAFNSDFVFIYYMFYMGIFYFYKYAWSEK